MENSTLDRARRFEAERSADIRDEMKPAFHLSPYVGWMNDPNGFSFYKGRYHMFYQYHPYDIHWGPMHWGHAVSDDLLHWEYLPAALAPDMPYDAAGCFSGSAIELPDGRQLLMYTGVRRERQADGQEVDVQTQCLAVGDGVNYTKYEGNPVLTEADLPEGASRIDFRDPKLFRAADGAYMAVIGSRPADGSGQFLLFRSEDAFHWSFFSILDQNSNRFGKMWECPDLFSLDGKDVILTSPQDMLADGREYFNGNGTLCLIGKYDPETGHFTEENNQTIDSGIDFYAPQTVEMPDGRRIMIGWMQNWDSLAIREEDAPWAGQMSLPRELSLRDGRLCQKPSAEFDALRKNRVAYENVPVGVEKRQAAAQDTSVSHTTDPVRLPHVSGRTVDLTLRIRPLDPQYVFQSFTVRFAADDCFHTDLTFRPYEETLEIDRTCSGSRRSIIHQRKCFLEGSSDGVLTLRIVLDRFSSEVFIGNGEKTMTTAIYTDPSADGILFLANGKALVDIEKFEI